jgi:hypothetical protein
MADCSDVLLKELGSNGGQIVKLRIAIQRYKNQVNYNCNQRHIIRTAEYGTFRRDLGCGKLR